MLTPYSSPDILGTIIDAMPDFIFWKDTNGVFRGCNHAFAKLCFGMSREEVVGKSDFDLMPDAEMAAKFQDEDRAIMSAASPRRLDIWFKLADGSRRCLEAQKIPMTYADGEVYGLLVVARDITDAKCLGEALQVSETRYRTLFSNMNEGFAVHEIICDQKGVPCDYRFLEINEAFEKLTGLARKDVVGKRLSEVMPHEDAVWIDVYGKVALTGTSERFTRHSSILNRYYSVYAYSPAPCQFATLFMDSTDQIVSSQALGISEARLTEAQRLAKLGYWDLDHASGKLQWSDEIYRIFETDVSRFGSSYEAFFKAIHPDDREIVRNTFESSLQTHTPYGITHRILLAGNRIKYVHEQCETSFDAAGLPLRSSGTVQDITERKILQDELNRIAQDERELYSFHTIVTNSSALRTQLELAARVSKARQTTVALYGESGSGKEVLARAIHTASSNLPGKFIAVNCAAIPENLLESELFGHVRGAFTGADSDREGKFSIAKGGTILLDEIGDMPISLQVKLLRVLEERTFERIGSNILVQVECRIIVSTNRDLSLLVLEGRFREDLFHRINIFPLRIPPLRERCEDIPLLCDFLLIVLRHELGRPLPGISPQAMKLLLAYRWPGNVRELRNCLERAAIIADGGMIAPEHLAIITTGSVSDSVPIAENAITYNLSLSSPDVGIDALLDQIMAITLEHCNGNKAQAARILKIGRSAYYRSKA